MPQQFGGAFALFAGGPTEEARDQTDVLFYRPVRQKPELLDDIADFAAQFDRVESGDIFAVDRDAAATGREHAVDQPERGGFARSAASE